MKNRPNSRGAVLISVILLVALAASVASFLAWQQSLWLRQVENLTARAQAGVLARAGIDLAQDWLHTEKASIDKASGADWSLKLPPLPVEGGFLTGELRDQQGLFNLNNIVVNGAPTSDYEVAKRLFAVLALDPRLLAALRDWLDPDEDVSADGAESQAYLAGDPSHRSANQPLTSIESLYRVSGFNAKIIDSISPYVTVLPARVQLNLNTAPAEVLAARFGLPLTDAKTLVLSRDQARFTSLGDFVARVPPAHRDKITEQGTLTMTSEYFLAIARTELANANVAYRALLQRREGLYPQVNWLRLEQAS